MVYLLDIFKINSKVILILKMPNVPKTTDSERNMERASGNCCCPVKCSLSC